jgi:hypothetical protein
MNEADLSTEQILRLQAMQMAVTHITQHVESRSDLTALATEIYKFIKGETE